MVYPQPGCDANACTFAIGDRIDDLAPAVGTVTSRKELGIRCLSGSSVNQDSSAVEPNRCSGAVSFEKFCVRPLSDGEDDEVD
jgi:hypothetical protein